MCYANTYVAINGGCVLVIFFPFVLQFFFPPSSATDHSTLFPQENFLEVIQNQEFLLLPTMEIVKLLSSDDINVPDEETIFQALMTWVRYDVQHRQQDLGVLLALIRLPLLPPQVCQSQITYYFNIFIEPY